ncbi:hypothetical protein KJ865_01970 [Myxococcota bacterium]|nr:hypothetical protein [Myxococcota bacterium]
MISLLRLVPTVIIIIAGVFGLTGCKPPVAKKIEAKPVTVSPGQKFENGRALYTRSKSKAGVDVFAAICASGETILCRRAISLVEKYNKAHKMFLLHRGCASMGLRYCGQLARIVAKGGKLERGFPASLIRSPSPGAALSHSLIAFAMGNPQGAKAVLTPFCKKDPGGLPCLYYHWLMLHSPDSLADLLLLSPKRLCPSVSAGECSKITKALSEYHRTLKSSIASCERGGAAGCEALGDTLSYISPGIAPSGNGQHFPDSVAQLMTDALEKVLGPLSDPHLVIATPGAIHYARACALSSMAGCFGSWFLAAVAGHGEKKWEGVWFKKMDATCSRKNPDACFPQKVARVVAKDLHPDTEYDLFRDLSRQILRGARREEPQAFNTLARWHPFIYCGKNRYASVRKLLKEGCEAGSVTSCVQYGELLEVVGFFHKSRISKDSRRKSRRRLRLAAWAYGRSCARGDFGSCHQLSILYLNGFGVKKNLKKGQYLLKKAHEGLTADCWKNSGKACYHLARISRDASAPERHILHQRACAKGFIRSCLILASREKKRSLRERLLKLSSKMVSLKCATGDTGACVMAGAIELLQRGVPSGAPGANPWFIKGCRMHDPRSCWLASFTIELTATSTTTLRSAHSLQRKACLLNTSLPCEGLLPLKKRVLAALGNEESCQNKRDESCQLVGEALLIRKFHGYKKRFGELWRLTVPGVKTPAFALRMHKGNAAAVYSLLHRACQSKKSAACIGAYGVAEKYPGIVPAAAFSRLKSQISLLLQKECAGGGASACRAMALYCMQGKMGCSGAQRAKPYWDRAFSIYEAGCEKKRALDCYHAGQILDQSDPEAKNIEQVISYMDKACWWSVTPACTYLGLYWFTRSPTEKAGTYLAKACKLGDTEACYRAGRFYERRGSAKDVLKAKRFYARACRRKMRTACASLGQL